MPVVCYGLVVRGLVLYYGLVVRMLIVYYSLEIYNLVVRSYASHSQAGLSLQVGRQQACQYSFSIWQLCS
jgi:hypothetical protein